MLEKNCLQRRQVQKSDRINSDHQSGSDQLGSTRIDSDHGKIKNNKEMRLLPVWKSINLPEISEKKPCYGSVSSAAILFL